MRKVKILVGGTPHGAYITYAYPKGVHQGYFIVPTYDCFVYGKDNAGRDVSERFDCLRFGVNCYDGKTVKVVSLADYQTYIVKSYKKYKLHSTNDGENGAWVVNETYYIHNGPDNQSPNTMARQFAEENKTERQTDLVLFLDGYEKSGIAIEGDENVFRTTWHRPKWHIIFQDQLSVIEKRPKRSSD